MGITFNANEVFEMAEEIERNGAGFYRRAAEKASDGKIKKMLLDMAVMEDSHLETFEKMREQLSEREKEENVFDPANEAVMYLQTMADARSWEGRKSPDEELSGNETMKEILEIALNSEKESVVFYHGLRSLVSPKAGRDKIDAIINEELSHIRILLEQLKQLN